LRASRRRLVPAAAALGALLAGLAAGGCRQGMFDQAKYEPYEASPFFPDGAASRPLPAHTVARGFLRDDRVWWTGVDADGREVDGFPMAVDGSVLARGRRVYDVYCAPCHGATGAGDGMIVRRGFYPPPTLHQPRLREAPAGHFVNVVTEGLGRMPSYAVQVPPADRWAVAAYVRALQRSQGYPVGALSPDDRARLDRPAPAPLPAAAAEGVRATDADEPTEAAEPAHPEPGDSESRDE
jgi:mono/diheme cytochrome c family protein